MLCSCFYLYHLGCGRVVIVINENSCLRIIKSAPGDTRKLDGDTTIEFIDRIVDSVDGTKVDESITHRNDGSATGCRSRIVRTNNGAVSSRTGIDRPVNRNAALIS